jgi:competence protein ComEA
MRNRSSTTEHAEAVSRRLATLSAELASVRGDPREPPSDRQPDRESDRQPGPPVEGSAVEASAPAETPQPPAIPVPGRHAHRRLPTRAGPGALRLAPAHLVVLALVLAVGLAVTAWLVVRSSAEPAALPEVEPAEGPLVATSTQQGAAAAEVDTAGAGSDAGTAAVPGAAAEQDVTVDVAGKVRRPGIAVLPAGSRVVDAIEAAGGARAGVDLTALNLARLLVDGEQVLVGVPVPAAAGSVGAVPAPPGSDGPLVDINTADQPTLETLPGVGPVTATAIIDWRTEHGGFTSVEELLEVDGIGEATLDELAPHVTI